MPENDTQASASSDRLLYSVDGVAEQLSVGRTTVYSLIRAGRLRSVKVGDRTLVARDELERFVGDLAGVAS